MGEIPGKRELEVAILISKIFPTVISAILEEGLEIMNLRGARYRLGINSTKIDLIIFTTKAKTPEFHLPRLSRQILPYILV